MVGLTEDAYPLIQAGRLTVTWRLWKYAHVKAGKQYNLGSWDGAPGSIVIEDVRTVRVADVTDADAREAGRPDAETLVAFCASHTGATVTPDTLLYRVAFHWSPEVLKKPELPLDEIARRCAKLDATSPWGPWTEQTLRLIEEYPQTVSWVLARELDIPRAEFKLLVRKLKALALTVSYPIGYELSELGMAYLDYVSGVDPEAAEPRSAGASGA
ncbi:MAG TPA: hypothetical protein VH951_11610 [Dehalococcoidia bacterium]